MRGAKIQRMLIVKVQGAHYNSFCLNFALVNGLGSDGSCPKRSDMR